MKRTDDDSVLPDWKCERYLLGELDAGEMERIARRVEHDEALRARLAELEQSNREILQRHPAREVSRQIERRLAAARSSAPEKTRRGSWLGTRLVWVPVALAALVATLLVLDPGRIAEWEHGERGGLGPESTRIKGPAAVLSLYRRTGDGSERLENHATAAAHDRILATYSSDGQTYGLILSVDGRGVLTRHHPPQDGPALLLAGGPHALDFSYELDDAPRWEIFILASSAATFDADAVIGAIGNSPLVRTPGLVAAKADSILQFLPLPEGVSLSTFTLIKEVGDEQ